MKYKTPPDAEEPLVIAAGGDVGSDAMSFKMGGMVAQHKPDIVILGGDLDYGNGLRGCYSAWDGVFNVM